MNNEIGEVWPTGETDSKSPRATDGVVTVITSGIGGDNKGRKTENRKRIPERTEEQRVGGRFENGFEVSSG